ncbi:MAG: hypothetical protein OEX02_16305, partial [Cyclobacteriaceae bacterium]|nr:hypothetical protein [Cyclobacteriaceae bacterium]
MNLPVIIEIIISMVFVYLVLSLLVSSINEYFNQLRSKRAKFLKHAITEVLNDVDYNKNFAETFYNHPLVDLLKEKQDTLPSYLSKEVFTNTLIDLIGEEYNKSQGVFMQDKKSGEVSYEIENPIEDDLKRFKAGLNTMSHSDLKILLHSFLMGTAGLDGLKSNIEHWFEAYMDRAGGWFKRKMKNMLLYISIAVTLAFNVDSIKLIKTLNEKSELRTTINLLAGEKVQEGLDNSKQDVTIPDLVSQYQDIQGLALPIGWEKETFSSLKNFW